MTDSLTLLEKLQEQYPDNSNASLRSWVKNKRVFINGEIARFPSQKVKKSDSVSLESKKESIGLGVKLLYRDQHIAVIEKPSGLLSVATEKELERTAFRAVKKFFLPKKVYVVHRLDQETSGLMVFALSEEANKYLKKELKEHLVKRQYAAIIEDSLSTTKGTWRSYLYEDRYYKVHSSEDPSDGPLAITHYSQLATKGSFSWLDIQLETGRKNQIRVHCEAAGHPIAGDKKYGAAIKSIKRLCLHAYRLEFTHPITKKLMIFTSSVPKSFEKIVKPVR